MKELDDIFDCADFQTFDEPDRTPEHNYQAVPAAQSIIYQDIFPAKKITMLVEMFHQDYPEEKEYPELNHPAVLPSLYIQMIGYSRSSITT